MLICLDCGNERYFSIEEETVKEVFISGDKIIIQDAVFLDFNQTTEEIRRTLYDTVDYILRANASFLNYDFSTGYYTNPVASCAQCFSTRVIEPVCEWRPKKSVSLDDEIIDNRKEFQNLRKESKTNENNLPVLWSEQGFPNSIMGKMYL